MQKVGDIELRGTTPQRWKPEPGRRLLRGLREQRACKVWAASMVTPPEPGESILDYMVRSKLLEKPLLLPIRTVGRTRDVIRSARAKKTQVVRRGEGKITMDPQPIDFGDPEAW